MILYNIKLARASLRDRPGLTALTIAAIAVGLALLTTMTTMSYQASKLPLRDKSTELQTILIDSRESNSQVITDLRRMPRLTYQDVNNLMQDDNLNMDKTYLWKSFAFLNDQSGRVNPRQVRTLAGQANFFSMFDVPFLYGSGWNTQDDQKGAPVIVLSFKMNQHFFGGENSVGKSIRINSTNLTVVGVTAEWKIPTRFYDRTFSSTRFDDVFIPSALGLNMKLRRFINCWPKDQALVGEFSRDNVEGLKASECGWLVMWGSANEEQRTRLQNYLVQYQQQQKSLGRLPMNTPPALLNILEYTKLNLDDNFDLTVFNLLATLFFLVCLVNTVGLLLAKYMGKIPEIAIRRALGAKKHVIMTQYLVEISLIAFVGGMLGIMLSYFGLSGMMHLYIYQSDYTVTAEAIDHLYQLDLIMIAKAMAIAVLSALVVSLFPVWKMVNTPPASHLKAQ